ncbi:MAG: GTPase HflX [Deltaproteobacteria bacterium]|nr:GTPase HflX [Deltaproteobacteria bacterium]
MNKKTTPERAFVLGVHSPKNSQFEAWESLEEAKNLVMTAGAELCGQEFIELRQFSPSTFFGQGKVEELQVKLKAEQIEVVIVDHELSPVQNRNLEDFWKVRVIDRTGLILDIFAQRAQSKEGKLQVELAQYQYILPRLVGAWTHLSKQKGGIGLRGPGETQLEVDRRRVRERITGIKKSLKKVTSSRELHRNTRQSVPIPTISLIGYTNAGKSTLFNQLVGASELAEDKLFATLDPKTRKLRLPSGQKVLMSDTVGFIRNLPHQLVESFKSTFEEVAGSDLLIHVIDASHPDREQQVQTVEKILWELGLNDKPVIKVMNKIDKLELDLFQNNALVGESRSVVKISGLQGYGLDQLLNRVEQKLSECYYRRMHLLIPHAKGKVLNELYTHASILSAKNTAMGSEVEVNLPPRWQGLYEEFEVA